ncbi:glycoside hydrolase family 79 protein, partial [Collybiopsis luxurians FD-317 M1]
CPYRLANAFIVGSFAEPSSTLKGARTNSFSEYHYQGTFCSGSAGRLSDLMNKGTVRGNLARYKHNIEATNSRGLDYILGETNSHFCHVCSLFSSLVKIES